MFWALVLVVITYVLVPVLRPLFFTQTRQNYRGHLVPTGFGLTFVFTSVLVLVARGQGLSLLLAVLLLFFALLGLVDDFLGDGSVKGLRGHFGQGRISTGTCKALGGICFALAISLQLSRGWLEVVVSTILVASAANFLNLLDLRPGRAGKAFIIFALPFIFLAPLDRDPLLWLLGAVAGYLPWDLREKVMMGDTGSNSLGATLGLVTAMILPTMAKILVVVVLVALNLLAEQISFSRVIERNRFLNFLDRLGRNHLDS